MRRLFLTLFLQFTLILLCLPVVRAQTTTTFITCGGTNDTAAFNSAIGAFSDANPGAIQLPRKTVSTRCVVNSLTIPAYVTLDNTVGSGVKINTGQELHLLSGVNNPDGKQLFYNALAGQGMVSLAGNYRLRYVQPDWWGAKGDFNGTTGTDNTAQFRATVAAIGTNLGGLVYLSNGHYLVSDQTNAVSGLTIEGSNGKYSDATVRSNSCSVVVNTAGKAAFFIGGGVREVAMRGFAIETTAAGQGTALTGTGGVRMEGAAGFSTFNITLERMGYSRLARAVSAVSTSGEWQIENVHVRDSIFAENAVGIFIDSRNADGWDMKGNNFSGGGGQLSYGIYAPRSSSQVIENNTITGMAVGIYFNGLTTSFAIRQNLTESCTKSVIIDTPANFAVSIDFQGNTFGDGVDVLDNFIISSSFNRYGQASFRAMGDTDLIFSVGDSFVDAVGVTCPPPSCGIQYTGNSHPRQESGLYKNEFDAPLSVMQTGGNYAAALGVGTRTPGTGITGTHPSVIETLVMGDQNVFNVLTRTGGGAYTNRSWGIGVGTTGSLAFVDLNNSGTSLFIDTSRNVKVDRTLNVLTTTGAADYPMAVVGGLTPAPVDTAASVGSVVDLHATGDFEPILFMRRTGGSGYTNSQWQFRISSNGSFFLQDGTTVPTNRLILPATGGMSVPGAVTSTSGISNFAKGADVASAATITVTGNLFHVTGTTTITSISGTGIVSGTTITIIFDGALTFTDGSNLILAGNFVTTANDTITLVWDGTAWFEKSRSIN